MNEIEQVIEGLEMSYTYSNVDEDNTLVPQQLVLDALALLKAQEPVRPKRKTTELYVRYGDDIFNNYFCGNCGELLHTVLKRDRFCANCGRAVKWDE